MRNGILIAGLCLAATSAQAGIWSSDDLLPWPDPGVKADIVEVTHPMFRALVLGGFKVKLEETRLADVAAAVGSGTIEHQGDAAGSYYWLCYRFRESGQIRQLGIFANGEMGGPDHDVTDVVLSTKAREPEARCPLLPRAMIPVKMDIGLGLMSTYADFTARLGKPGGRHGGKATWSFDHEIPRMNTSETWSAMQWVDAKFVGGKAVTVVFGQVTSD